MILHQFVPFFLVAYAEFFQQIVERLVYGVVLGHAQNHLLYRLEQRFDFSSLERVCADYHHREGKGTRPTHTVSRLLRVLLVKYLYDLSLRETETRLYTDLLSRWFAGYSLFDDLPDHTTIERFEVWVAQRQRRVCFDEVLRQIEADYPDESAKPQIGDTYAAQAQAARENLHTLLRHISLHILESAAQSLPAALTQAMRGFVWTDLFGAFKEKPWFALSKEERKKQLALIARAASELHTRVATLVADRPSHEFPELRKRLGNLQKILGDEFTVVGDEIERLPAKEQGAFRIGSATDPEATYRVHGPDPDDTAFGYNVQVAMTTSGLIRETQAYTGAEPDQSGVAGLVAEQKTHLEKCPPKLIYDQAAGNGKTRAEVQLASDGRTQLVSHLPPYDKRSERFGPYDFSLSPDGKQLTCPNEKVSGIAYRSGTGDGRDFRFFDFQCWSGEPPTRMEKADLSMRCPLWEKCRDSRQGPRAMRQVFISDYREQVLAAQQYNQTDEFRQEMKKRPRVERVIFELTHYNGARQCRRRGLAFADWQAKMVATAYNIKFWMRRLYSGTIRRKPQRVY
jgi:transposase